MIIIHSVRSDASATGRIWHSTCEACGWVQDGSSRPSVAIAGSIEHQRRCPLIKGATVEWHQDGSNMGTVTPRLALDLRGAYGDGEY